MHLLTCNHRLAQTIAHIQRHDDHEMYNTQTHDRTHTETHIHRETGTPSCVKAQGLTHDANIFMLAHMHTQLILINPRGAERNPPTGSGFSLPGFVLSVRAFHLQIPLGENLPGDPLTPARKLSSPWTIGPVLTPGGEFEELWANNWD